LNGFTINKVHMNMHRVTRIRSGSPVNAGGLDTHSTYDNKTANELLGLPSGQDQMKSNIHLIKVKCHSNELIFTYR